MNTYNFQILTTEGIIDFNVDSEYDFSGAPFGFVPYKEKGSCELSQDIIDEFWRCIDIGLQNNNLLSENFIRAIRAYCGENIFGDGG